ncbi:hypothetical protein DFP72DRAFT_1045616 [Ephemerocybe angulata]|uniref:Uncharacterized protein n=1 Tax=Ephemerocybe angulata TaxID=980116 RepID=A0A8H6HXK3_9AGAR|nr:hypothetical protein DFP72DRAFT_1045616 [Tulosesus angulatus]
MQWSSGPTDHTPSLLDPETKLANIPGQPTTTHNRSSLTNFRTRTLEPPSHISITPQRRTARLTENHTNRLCSTAAPRTSSRWNQEVSGGTMRRRRLGYGEQCSRGTASDGDAALSCNPGASPPAEWTTTAYSAKIGSEIALNTTSCAGTKPIDDGLHNGAGEARTKGKAPLSTLNARIASNLHKRNMSAGLQHKKSAQLTEHNDNTTVTRGRARKSKCAHKRRAVSQGKRSGSPYTAGAPAGDVLDDDRGGGVVDMQRRRRRRRRRGNPRRNTTCVADTSRTTTATTADWTPTVGEGGDGLVAKRSWRPGRRVGGRRGDDDERVLDIPGAVLLAVKDGLCRRGEYKLDVYGEQGLTIPSPSRHSRCSDIYDDESKMPKDDISRDELTECDDEQGSSSSLGPASRTMEATTRRQMTVKSEVKCACGYANGEGSRGRMGRREEWDTSTRISASLAISLFRVSVVRCASRPFVLPRLEISRRGNSLNGLDLGEWDGEDLLKSPGVPPLPSRGSHQPPAVKKPISYDTDSVHGLWCWMVVGASRHLTHLTHSTLWDVGLLKYGDGGPDSILRDILNLICEGNFIMRDANADIASAAVMSQNDVPGRKWITVLIWRGHVPANLGCASPTTPRCNDIAVLHASIVLLFCMPEALSLKSREIRA